MTLEEQQRQLQLTKKSSNVDRDSKEKVTQGAMHVEPVCFMSHQSGTGLKIKTLRTDGGDKYISANFENFLRGSRPEKAVLFKKIISLVIYIFSGHIRADMKGNEMLFEIIYM